MTDRLPHRPFCGICNAVVRVDFHVPDHVWEAALHHSQLNMYVCLDCFTSSGDERGVDWSQGIKFEPLTQVGDARVKAGCPSCVHDRHHEACGVDGCNCTPILVSRNDKECGRCDGTGRVDTPWSNPNPDETVCIFCDGTGVAK